MMAKAWVLASRPEGEPTDKNFRLEDQPSTDLSDGQIRVANRWLSVDPYMRGRMNDTKSYVPPFQVGEPMQGGAVGEVVESRNDKIAVGQHVLHMHGWRDEAVVDATQPAMAGGAQPLPDGLPPQSFLGMMGLTGATAYFGLLKTAEAKAGDVVFVSAAAGAVGSAVVQIAKAKGMTVIGSAGGPDKCAWVKELGADEAIDYKAGPIVKALGQAAPDGIDVYFDNVGGDHLDAAYAHAKNFARFAICGMIDHYNDGHALELRHFMRTISARIRTQGFIYTDYASHMGEFLTEMGGWLQSGQVKSRETVHEGLASMPDAFQGLFEGGNMGKMLVKV